MKVFTKSYIFIQLKFMMASVAKVHMYLPMVALREAIGRLSCVVNLSASVRISSMLFIKAKRGASGKAATKIVTKPNWITERSTGTCHNHTRTVEHHYISRYLMFHLNSSTRTSTPA